ncbi:hypothetical protein F5Y16DRAFT_357672 [Xylariaceae sp. FL0255]|nr:hypothetical protein F5Y16DRAFT_357672 [Xylariaceae sp. FL0255]
METDELDSTIEEVEEKLETLTRQIEEFEEESKIRTTAEHNLMFSQLRESIQTINSTMRFLDQDNIAKDDKCVDMPTRLCLEDRNVERTIVNEHTNTIYNSFSQLRKTVALGLKEVEGIKCQFSDFEVLLDNLRNDLDAAATRARALSDTTTSLLSSKESALEDVGRTLGEKQCGIKKLETELGGLQDLRHRMRKERITTLAASIVYPPIWREMFSLEIEARDRRLRIEELKERIKDEETRVLSLEKEKATLTQQRKSLVAVITNSKALNVRCEELSARALQACQLVESRLVEYHNLASQTEDFATWAGDLVGQATVMKLFGSSSRLRLQNITTKIVTQLLDNDHEDVKVVCIMDLKWR